MKWKNLGLLYKPESIYDWMTSHASLPTILQIDKHNFKIFFSTRDHDSRSHTTFVNLNLKEWTPGTLLKNKNKLPNFSPNSRGFFDDSGVSVSSFIKIGKIQYAYYMGWTKKLNIPFSNEIGIAVVDSKYNLKRIQSLPIFGKSELEPFTFGYPTVLKNKNKTFMFYDSIDKWNDNDPNKYKFDLRFAVMKGLNKWEHCKKIVLETNKEIRAVTRPSFIQSPKGLVMVYSCDINGKYKLKAAIQNKHSGQKWIRDKSFSFNSSGQDWDSDEQSYCNIFNHEKDYYMLYNGNKYGKTGFGIAKLLSF